MKTIIRDERVKEFVAKQNCLVWISGLNSVGIGVEDDGQIVAGIVFDGYNGASVSMFTAATAPLRDWMAGDYLPSCFSYAFEELGAKRITVWEPAANIEGQKFSLHLGFEYEATLEDFQPAGAMIVYRMTKDKCPFLGAGHSKGVVH